MHTNKNKIRYHLLLFLKGSLMGLADLIPGVSGGTIAFISGIYEELIESIASININAIKVLRSEGPFKFWSLINGNFLLTLVCGVLFSVILFSRLVYFLLIEEKILVSAFFFGLILASSIYILRDLTSLRYKEILGVISGFAVVLLVSMTPIVSVTDSFFVLFFGGSLAICAMILPGISGSLILLLLGIYPIVLGAIGQFQWNILLIFGLGCIFGLLVFSRILIVLLKAYRPIITSILTGFLFGSLAIVWPWRYPIDFNLSQNDVKFFSPYQLFFPDEFLLITEQSPQTFTVISLMVIGFLAVFAVGFISKKITR
ncbi:MAG: hypothetical protein CMK44_04070 [Porticoccus sp.]|jgi:putative membrane protein|nr:hypothetical protein [Porticoccus sp.]